MEYSEEDRKRDAAIGRVKIADDGNSVSYRDFTEQETLVVGGRIYHTIDGRVYRGPGNKPMTVLEHHQHGEKIGDPMSIKFIGDLGRS